MTRFDIFLLVVLAGSAAWGYHKGVFSQIGTFGGIVAAVLLCGLAGPWLAHVIAAGGFNVDSGDKIPEPTLFQSVVARVVLFLAGFLGVKLVARLCRNVIHAVALGFVDRLCGAVLCMFEWLLLVSVGLNVWIVMNPHFDVDHLSGMGNFFPVRLVVGLAPELLGWAL